MVAAVQRTANSHNGPLGGNVQLLGKVCVDSLFDVAKHRVIVPQIQKKKEIA